jgi:tetratricopeptide (TPR) repeat protein
MGVAYLRQEMPDLAETHLRQALEIRRALQEIGPAVSDLSFLGLVYLKQGELEMALDYSHQAMDLLTSADVVVNWEQEIHFNHYRVCQVVGLHELALASLEQAYKVMLDMAAGMPEEGRRTFLEDVEVNRHITRTWQERQSSDNP